MVHICILWWAVLKYEILTSFPIRRSCSQALVSATSRRCFSSPSRRKRRAWWSSPRAHNSSSYFERGVSIFTEIKIRCLVLLLIKAYICLSMSSSVWPCSLKNNSVLGLPFTVTFSLFCISNQPVWNKALQYVSCLDPCLKISCGNPAKMNSSDCLNLFWIFSTQNCIEEYSIWYWRTLICWVLAAAATTGKNGQQKVKKVYNAAGLCSCAAESLLYCLHCSLYSVGRARTETWPKSVNLEEQAHRQKCKLGLCLVLVMTTLVPSFNSSPEWWRCSVGIALIRHCTLCLQ